MTATLDSLFPGHGPVLLDGAMGTALLGRGWKPERPSTVANLQAAQDVLAIHREHRRAGAQVLTTNTFAALSVDEEQREGAVRAGVELARQAASELLHTPASSTSPNAGPSPAERAAPDATRSEPTPDPARVAGCVALFGVESREQELTATVKLLVAQEVDLLVFETCHTVRAAQVALQLKRSVAAHLPMVICVSSTDGSVQDHRRVAEVLSAIRASEIPGVEAGLNCCRGPEDTLTLSLSTSPPIRWVKPSTSLPDQPADQQSMAAFARAARLRGVRFVGACCGSNAATLSAMANTLQLGGHCASRPEPSP